MRSDRSTRIVAIWIFTGVAMLIVQVLLGGITRLTGSGLSITEWKPIMGALPPMGVAEWQLAFEKYKQIAQYKYLNEHFTLSDFKFIFFWEWFHRLWARVISVVFIIPFIYFLVKGYFKKGMVVPLILLFLFGALQGAIGWIMVQSGLNDTNLYVSHIRLAVHFVAAMILIGFALIFALQLVTKPQDRIAQPMLKKGAVAITVLITIQLIYGAFMAGLKAANVAPTWPDINGAIVPENIFTQGSWINDIVQNKLSIHFIHRTLAYILLIAIFVWWWKARKISYSKPFNQAKNLTLFFVALQVVLGVLAVIYSPKITMGQFGVFEWMALGHQLVGMLLFLNFAAILYFTRASSANTSAEHKILKKESAIA